MLLYLFDCCIYVYTKLYNTGLIIVAILLMSILKYIGQLITKCLPFINGMQAVIDIVVNRDKISCR